MPFNGAGVYSPPAADFPAVANTLIESAHFNNVINDIAVGLSNCVTKDGQQTITANIPFNGFYATSGGIRAMDGLVGTPSLSFINDTDCGFYRIGVNNLGLALNGAKVLDLATTGMALTGLLTVSGTAAVTGALTAISTLDAQAAITQSGIVSPAQITANQNDYNPASLATASVLRVNSDARRSLTGLQGGAAGRIITVNNVGTFPILFKSEDTNSTAGNRFAFGHTLSGGHTLKIQYDAVSSRWRCVSKEDPAGTLKDFAGGTVPEGYLARDGSNISRTTFASLFNEVGTTWGVGDGATTFGVGDDRRRSYIGSGGAGTGTIGNAVGNTGGEEGHALTVGENGTHGHTPGTGDRFVTLSAGADGAQVQVVGGGDAVQGSSGSAGGNTANSGSGTAHNTYHPCAVVTKIIKY